MGSTLAASVVLASSIAYACCGYGCCDCGCVTAVSEEEAEQIMDEIDRLLLGLGFSPTIIDLVTETDDGVIVLYRSESGEIEQPSVGGIN